MSFFPLKSTLRIWRRTAALRQKEVAKLLGGLDPSSISLFESGKRQPSFEVAIALQVLTGKSLEELFPRAYLEIESKTLESVRELLTRLGDSNRATVQCKRKHLNACLKRVITKTN